MTSTQTPWTAFSPARQSTRVLIAPDGAAYDLTVAVPAGAAPEHGYPAIVVLDGASHFQIVAGAAAALARRPEKTGVPNLVVIGISPRCAPDDPERRSFDFTDGPPEDGPASAPSNGGAEAFLDFLADVVLPAVAAAVRLDPTRLSLFGHSLGALFALFAMTRRPVLFSSWLLISPSIWWRPGLPAQAAAALRGRDCNLYLGWGELEAGGSREMASRASLALADFAAAIGAHRVAGGVLAGEDHGSAPIAACAAALRVAGNGRHSVGGA
jgi:predicted alpha/beta superfamily hydrolase